MSVEVEMVTPRVAQTVGLAAVLEKLPLASLAHCEASERHRREHRCEYPGCMKVKNCLQITDVLITVAKIRIFPGVHKELSPEGPQTNSHWGKAIRMHLARMSVVILEE